MASTSVFRANMSSFYLKILWRFYAIWWWFLMLLTSSFYDPLITIFLVNAALLPSPPPHLWLCFSIPKGEGDEGVILHMHKKRWSWFDQMHISSAFECVCVYLCVLVRHNENFGMLFDAMLMIFELSLCHLLFIVTIYCCPSTCVCMFLCVHIQYITQRRQQHREGEKMSRKL